ncbi:MAG: HAD family hydrolase [Deltaproteobacteria bacterium]|nr:HAD family hydrolase [Deltaproteobacteria bacterium]
MNSKKKRSAVIFDCDGVMFDSRQANINFYNHILAHFDLPPMTEDSIAFVHMNTADESIRCLFRKTPLLKDAQEFIRQVDYTPFIGDMIIEPGLKELLKKLRPRFGLAVATNRSNTIGKVLECNGLDRVFDIVVSSLDVKNPKPHPESIFKILDYFGIKPPESIYVGDSMVDYETARAAGVIFISYKNRELEADYYTDSMSDIADIVGDNLQGAPV